MGNFLELFQKYGTLAWRRRWWGILAAWIICLAGWAYVARMPDQFEANARVYINADEFLTPVLRGLAVETSLDEELDLLTHMLMSRPSIERIIAKTDLQLDASSPTETERLVDSLTAKIKMVAQTRNIFSITYRNSSRQLATDVVSALLNSFIEHKAGNNRDELDRTSTFLDGEIATYEEQLRKAEAKRAAFKKKYVELLPGDGGQNQLEMARAQLQNLQGQLADALAHRALIANQMKKTPPTVDNFSPSGTPLDPHTQLHEAEDRLRDLKQLYTDKYPEVVSQERLVASLRNSPEAPSTATHESSNRPTSNPVYEQFSVHLVETDAQIQSLQRQIGEATHQVDRLNAIARGVPELEAENTNLIRDYDVVRKNYDELVTRRESIRIADAAQQKANNIKIVIIDPPTLPRVPVAPNRTLLAIGVLLAGIGAGTGVVAAFIALDQSFHTLNELRALGVPVIGGISLAASPPTAIERLRGAVVFAMATGSLVIGLVGLLNYFSWIS